MRKPIPKLTKAVTRTPHACAISHVRLVLQNIGGTDIRKTTSIRIELTREATSASVSQ